MKTDNCFELKLSNTIGLKDTTQNIVKFIHASDIHLGAAQYRNEYRANDFIHAFREILELALKHGVDFVLLGGDVFTSLEILPGQLTKIVKILKDSKNLQWDLF